jgi:hypothetical protein
MIEGGGGFGKAMTAKPTTATPARRAEMGRTCTVCSHKDVDEINRLLLSGTSDMQPAYDLAAIPTEVQRPKSYLEALRIRECR